MIKSVLIANRGEIACRIIKTARKLGIRTVVVYSDVDAHSKAVQSADEAYPIGPAPALESYLNVPLILAVAKQGKVEAIHPGYGFLSENGDFAKVCCDEGFIFIGPSPKSLQDMGSKKCAKEIAKKLNVPIIPQCEGTLEPSTIGYPLVIKAVMGGGGKGMRVVKSAPAFEKALQACRREAKAAFGREEVFLEKYVPDARHIEVQIFGDSQGNLVHLFERDCTLQRRHQKIVEEAPSGLPLELKDRLYKAALTLGKAIHYENAGTVEFLVDRKGNYYFMEMNPRLQVEHPATETITGLDLVEWQFRVASKEKLPLTQEEILAKGHAIELRLYAEDPAHNFKPVTGEIWTRSLPTLGRVDTGLKEFDKVTSYYDSLLAKLIVQGDSRGETLKKASRALAQWEVLGLQTNASFLKNLLQDKQVIQNEIDVDFIDRHISMIAPMQNAPENVYVAASLIKILSKNKFKTSPWEEKVHWRLEGYASFHFEWICGEERQKVSLTYSLKGWILNSSQLLVASLSENTLFFSDFRIPYWERDEKISLFYEGINYNLVSYTPETFQGVVQKREAHLKAPLTGKVILNLVSEGDWVKEGQPLLILEAMKIEHTIVASRDGKIKQLFYREGSIVEEGADVLDMGEKE
ncbi:MAG: ATP-grasp domain-containing protein [Alphaproteobacteria bacterium]|nr:ATP-grasp domain-containing protein [Alphaproteobacteria bacterium]